MSTAAIFTGPWVNHSHGLLIGATLTLKTRDAGFLLAVLVVVVGATGRAFWFIASYVLHQLRCNEDSHDALFYQQQAILKNSAGSLGAAWKFAPYVNSSREKSFFREPGERRDMFWELVVT